MVETNLKSKCCNANIELGGIGDFNDKDRVETHYYVCQKCKKACDINDPINDTEEDNKIVRYNMGCGPKSLENYINIDGLGWKGNVDIIQNLTEVPYNFAKDNSADEIVSVEVLEHIGFKYTLRTLKEWYRILKFDGKLQIQVPACDKMMEMFVNKEICECCAHKPKSDKDAQANPDCFACGGKGKVHPNRWLFAFLGAQKHEFDNHLNIFTKDRLTEVLKQAGFKDINITYDKYNWKLIAKASK